MPMVLSVPYKLHATDLWAVGKVRESGQQSAEFLRPLIRYINKDNKDNKDNKGCIYIQSFC